MSVPKTSFFSAEKSGAGKGRGKGGVKRKKRKADDDGVDRAWNSVSTIASSYFCSKKAEAKFGFSVKQFAFKPPKKL